MTVEEKLARLLIVEDNNVVARTMARQLEAYDFTVCAIIGGGVGVIAAVQEQHPTVVLMDVGLPGRWDGITLAEEIFVCEDTPVVLLSGDLGREVIQRAARCGAYGYLAKPCPVGSTAATLRLAIHKHAELRSKRARAALLKQANDAVEVAVVVLEPSGQLEFMNHAAHVLTGTSLSEAKVRRPTWALQLEQAELGGDPVAICLAAGSGAAVDCILHKLVLPDGKQVCLLERTSSHGHAHVHVHDAR